jgi:hypothetical protein
MELYKRYINILRKDVQLLFSLALQLSTTLATRPTRHRSRCASRSYVPELDETRERVIAQAIADGTVPSHPEVCIKLNC